MNFASYQNSVASFVQEHSLDCPVESRLLDLVSETGELAKEMLKSSQYGKAAFSSSKSWGEELGDVFFSLICLANVTEVNLDQALAAALAKYATRLGQKGAAGSGG